MPFNEEYKKVMNKVAEIGSSAASAYTESQRQTERPVEEDSQTGVDWGRLVNSFAGAAQNWIDERNTSGRKWNDFQVDARLDDSTQKTIILVVCILAGALIFYGLKTSKK